MGADDLALIRSTYNLFFCRKVHIVADAVSSRTQIDRRLALERMKGIFVVFLIT